MPLLLPDPNRQEPQLPARSEQPTYGYGYAPDPRIDQGGLLDYWRILRRRKGTVLLISFMGLLGALLVTLLQTPVYQARASLEVHDLNQDFMNMKQVSQESQTYSALTDIQTQIKILQSETLTARTIDKLKLAKPGDLDGQPSQVADWRNTLNLPEPEPVGAREAALKAAAKSLNARAAGQTRIIEVLVDSTDPKLAAAFANTLTNGFIDQNMEARWQMSQRTGDWLSRQLDDMRIKLERSEDALQAYARRAGLIFTQEKTNVSDEKLRQVQQALTTASSDRVAKQSRYEMAQTSPPEALPDVLNDASLREYQVKLTDLKRQIAELSTTYTPDYAKVKRLQAQVQTLESALERERTAITSRIKNEYDEALRREKLLTADYVNQVHTVTGESEKSIQYNILKREVDSNRQLYDAMLQRLKESSIASAMKASNVRVVDAAAVPKKPYKPSLPLNLALGLFAGGFIGMAVVVMRERARHTFLVPGDVPLWLEIPELGAIPNSKALYRHSFYHRSRKNVPGPKASAVLALSPPNPSPEIRLADCVELVALQHKPSMVAEAFRAVLASIHFLGHNGTRPRVLVITSCGPSEGKTTVACNLAVALAEIGRRVLLIDADMRKPRVHSIFGLENDRGLVDMLRVATLDKEMLRDFVKETPVGLHVLLAGPATPAAANLLFVPHISDLLAWAKNEFDLVLIDTPPMLQMPDARILGRMADGVLLVVRADQTTKDAALAAQQRFSEDQTRVLGTILNDWDPKTSPGGYYRCKHSYEGCSKP